MTERKPRKPHDPPHFTPTWMGVGEAARGWGVSRRQAYRIIRAEEKRVGRTMSRHGKIRVADFLAVPRGDVAAAPMIPEVRELSEKVEALLEQAARTTALLGSLARRIDQVARERQNATERQKA